MSWIILTAVLATGAESVVAEVSAAEALVRLSDEVQTGSLLVSRGDCVAVKVYSASALTHVAAVVVEDEKILVYDATGGAGVRKQFLSDYLVGLRDARLHPFHPVKPLSEKQKRCFEQHLESQLGRPYAIKHHLTGNRARGLHCSEYVTDALMAAEILSAQNPARVSPASLVEGALESGLYRSGESLELVLDFPDPPANQSWCGWLWFQTKECTFACCRKMRGWIFCK